MSFVGGTRGKPLLDEEPIEVDLLIKDIRLAFLVTARPDLWALHKVKCGIEFFRCSSACKRR